MGAISEKIEIPLGFMQKPKAKTPEDLPEELRKTAAIGIRRTEVIENKREEQQEVNFTSELPGSDEQPESDDDSFKMKPGWERAFGSVKKKKQ